MSVTLVKINNPFDIRDRDITSVKLDAARPFQDFLSEYVHISDELEYHASINGRVFAPDEIPAQLVAPGDYVAVCPVLRGGGGNGGKNPLAILAGIALAAFAFGVVAPGVSGMFGGSAIAGKLAGGITLMVGGQLISNAFGPKMKESEDTESYRWGSLQPITAQGAVIPITYGTVRTAGQVLNQYIRVDGDTQYMELLLCGGQGHIDEFSDIRINDNPAENFQNVTWDTRPGDNSQTPISGFENLYDTQYVGVTLKCGNNSKGEEDKDIPGEWFVSELEGDSADYLEVTLDFPEGMGWYPETRSGPESHWVKPEFEYSMETAQGSWGSWVPWFIEEFEGATAKPFTRVRRTGKLTSGRYRVRARMLAKDGAHPTKDKNTTVWTSLTTVVESPMVHPGKALLGIKMQATDQLNQSTPTVTWRQTRNNVLVYMNGQWQQKNARNPAWIIYDLCVQARSLDGTVHVFGESPERMDLTAFAAWAAWNEQSLGNRGPIVMNLLVDETKDLWQWVNDVAASARGAVVMRGTKISCIWDQPSEPVQLFSMGNIVAGSFSGEFLSVDGRANAVEISFLNEAKNFEREQITVYGHGFDDADNRANPVSVELTGITNFDAAWQEGLYRLNQNRYILRTITFTADIDAIACQVGDVILVQHDVPRWGQGGRILSVEGNTVVVDHALELNEGVTYNVMIRRQSDDSILQRTAAATGSGATTMITISSAAGISPYDVFAIGEMQAVAKPFRVQEMSRSDDLHITLTCTEYIAALYTEDGVPPIIDYSLPSNRIAGLALTPGGYYSSTGQWVPELWANWSYRGQKPVAYEVEWKYDQGLWEQRRNTMETTAQCPLRETVALYSVRVRALYTSAPPSDWVYATSEGVVIGNGIPPDAPTNLTANGLFGFASLEWVNPTNSDLSHIEIWENDKDELMTASLVGQTRANSFTRMLPAGGTKWYWVRAVNYTGQKSDYNSQAGTPCVIDPESAEAWITDYLEKNPWLLEALEELNTRIKPLEINIHDINLELQDINIDLSDIDFKLANVDITLKDIDTNITEINTDIAEIKEITIPTIQADLQGQITDNRNEINQNLATAMDMIAEGVLRLADQADYVGDVFRWAGMEINPEEGTVVIRALEDLKTETGYQFSNVEQRLDAQTADINLKASRAYVDESVASIIAAIIAAEEWKFNGTLGGWTAQNATLTAQPGGMQYVVTAETPSLTSPDFSIPGNVNNIIGLQFSQTAGAINAVIKVQYKTPDHGYSDSYMRRINVVGDISFTRSVQINMHELTAGGSDWKDSTITGIRLFIGASVGQEYQINFVNIGQSSMSDLALQDLELRITQAEIDIDGANAAIALKADETTVTALQQRLNSAEVRIDGLNSAIALKADQTTVDGVNTRLQSAEVEIDALNGRISQQVIDYEGIQGQIDDLTAAAIQNSINEHEGQEERRIKLALARQELNARIDDTNEAVANYRLELLAIINENSALYESQITAVANDLSSEVQARETLSAKVGQNTAAIQTEQTARSTADEALSNRITTLQSTVNGNTAAIQTEQTTRANADTALSNRITTMQSTVNSNTSAIQTEAQTRADADTAEAKARQTLASKVSQNTAAIQTEATTRANADSALSTRIDTLQSTVNSNTAAIQTEAKARADADSAEAQARQTLATKVNSNTAAIQTEQTTRANADTALSNQISTLRASVNSNTAAIQAEETARAAADTAEANARKTLQTTVDKNTTAIQTEETARINADNGLSSRITSLQTKVNSNTAEIQTEQQTRATADSVLASQITTIQAYEGMTAEELQAQIDALTAASFQNSVNEHEGQEERRIKLALAREELSAEIDETNRAVSEYRLQLLAVINENSALYDRKIQAVADDLSAEVTSRETLAATVGQNTAAIQTEQTARASADSGLAQQISTLQTKVNGNTAAIQNEAKARADADTAEVSARQALQTKVNENTSAIQTETEARVNADSGLSSQISTLQTKVNNNTVAIQDEAKVRAEADKAEADARITLSGKVEDTSAAIQEEQRLRIEGDKASASAITQMKAQIDEDIKAAVKKETDARVTSESAIVRDVSTIQTTLRDPRTGKGLIASVQQNAQAIANTNGTLETKYTLKLDSNGYVVGYQLYNGGDSKSTFTLSADSFVVAKPGSTNPRQMLVYDSASGMLVLNSLMVNRAAIKDASVDTLKLAGRSVTIPVGYNDFSGISWGTNNSGVVGVYKPLQVSNGSSGYANVSVGISNVVVNEPIYIIFSCDLQASICTLGFSFDVKIGSVSQGGREISSAFTALKNERRSGSFSTSFIITPKNSGLAFIYPYWRISYTHAANDGSFNFNHSYIGYFSLLALQCKR